uniref:Uncharacterized protein n=1 Tax=Anguilla anguilla TaxID=7936 RepID=A0A0E9XDE2_ANGAN
MLDFQHRYFTKFTKQKGNLRRIDSNERSCHTYSFNFVAGLTLILQLRIVHIQAFSDAFIL